MRGDREVREGWIRETRAERLCVKYLVHSLKGAASNANMAYCQRVHCRRHEGQNKNDYCRTAKSGRRTDGSGRRLTEVLLLLWVLPPREGERWNETARAVR